MEIRNNMGNLVRKLCTPQFVQFSSRNRVHLMNRGSFRLIDRPYIPSRDPSVVYDIDHTFEIEPGVASSVHLRCCHDFWVFDGASVTEEKHSDVPLCKKCLGVIQAALRTYIDESVIYHINRGLLEGGVKLGYYWYGNAYNSGCRVVNGPEVGTLTFKFKPQDGKLNTDHLMECINVPILDVPTWTWFFEEGADYSGVLPIFVAQALGTWIAKQIIKARTKVAPVGIGQTISDWQSGLELVLFEE